MSWRYFIISSGRQAVGEWKLEIQNLLTGGEAVLESWELDLEL